MAQPEVAVNVAECVRLSKEKAAIAEKLEELYAKWGGTGVNYEKHALRFLHSYRPASTLRFGRC